MLLPGLGSCPVGRRIASGIEQSWLGVCQTWDFPGSTFLSTSRQPASGFDSQEFHEFVANTRNLVKFMTFASGPFLCGL